MGVGFNFAFGSFMGLGVAFGAVGIVMGVLDRTFLSLLALLGGGYLCASRIRAGLATIGALRVPEDGRAVDQ
jgi:uncharacterized BrkB/YihY/UPF0761 family membrane protein